MKMDYILALALLFSVLTTIDCMADKQISLDTVINKYISAEKNQDYAIVFQLFSAERKKRFSQEYAVVDTAGYMKLRYGSEARWISFIEKSRRELDDTAIATFEVVIEESGVRDNVLVTVKLLFLNGAWWIDGIDY